MKVRITSFADRHFNPKSAGTKITSHTKESVEKIVNKAFDNFTPDVFDMEKKDFGNGNLGYGYIGYRLIDGYADFCKLLVVKNFTDANVGTAKITNENYVWLRSSYRARTDDELPVLTRALHLPMPSPEAKYLVFVLYTKEHLESEHNDKYPDEPFEFEDQPEVEWGVVAILGQMINIEQPMTPATMTRNHLGKNFGGSGSEIDENAYLRSVEFWQNNALVK